MQKKDKIIRKSKQRTRHLEKPIIKNHTIVKRIVVKLMEKVILLKNVKCLNQNSTN